MQALLVGTLLAACIFQGLWEKQEDKSVQSSASDYRKAVTTPLGKYPRKLTYTLGKMTSSNNSNLPKGESYEDNVYTRYLESMLNIQNENAFEEEGDTYYGIVNMAAAERNLPDVMQVRGLDNLQTLVEHDLIADLTESFEHCASDRIKEIYGSYDESMLGNVTFDGKLMAIPETNISDGPQLLWLRKDWMEKLDLDPPGNLEEAEEIIRQFVTRDPGGNGAGNTIGLACESDICGEIGYNYEYHLDLLFASRGSYPMQWMKNAEGKLFYGGVEPETREALAYISRLYKEGILDKKFLVRTNNNVRDMIVDGTCGAFFGPWWAPNNPLMEAVQADPQAQWQPYLLPNSEDGTTYYAKQNASTQYVVVRKGYAHPEIVVKIISVLFDHARYEDRDNRDFVHYYQWNVDPTARPFSINVDYSDALSRCYHNLKSVFEGEKEKGDLQQLEQSYYQSCIQYMENPREATPQEWAAYMSRVEACELLEDAKTEEIKTYYFAETETMRTVWWKLQELQEKAYLEIITGQQPLDYFDTFVEQWKESGGNRIIEEVNGKYEGR